MSKPVVKDGMVKKYSGIQIIEHWIAFILVMALMISGLVPFLNDFVEEALGSRGGYRLPEIGVSQHWNFAVLLLVLCLVHLLIHSKNRDILSRFPKKDLRNSFHAVLYFFLMAKKPERGSGEKYRGNQKITYLAFAFTIGLLTISGFIMHLYPQILHDHFMEDPIRLTHIFGALMMFIVVLWHFGIAIRKRDWTAMKAIFLTGKLPLWYVRKNHKIWYDENFGAEASFAGVSEDYHGKDPLVGSLLKVTEGIPVNVVEAIAKGLRINLDEKDIDKMVEVTSETET